MIYPEISNDRLYEKTLSDFFDKALSNKASEVVKEEISPYDDISNHETVPSS